MTQLQARAQVRIDCERGRLAQLRDDPGADRHAVARHFARRVRADVRDVMARLRRPW